MRKLPVLSLFFTLLLAACTGAQTPVDVDPQDDLLPEEPPQQEEQRVTRNVTYLGKVEELGITIYQQGTHRLTLDNGTFILLEPASQAVNLQAYLGQRVEVRGSTQPTVEDGGTIMSVESISSLSLSSSSSSPSQAMCGGIAGLPCDEGYVCVDDPSDDCDPTAGGADCAGICVRESDNDKEDDQSSASSSSSSVSSSPIPASPSSPSSPSPSNGQQPQAPSGNDASSEKIELMASQNYADASLWSQEYCTSHIGFCVPVHRNWYYKSFGATTSNLWQVEFDISPIDVIGQGPILLQLAPGSVTSAGASDGEIRTQNGMVIGYRQLDENRHFRLIADARLREPLSHMLAHIRQVQD